MLFYRVEHRDSRQGVYHHDLGRFYRVMGDHYGYNSWRHPTFKDDYQLSGAGIVDITDYVFGFSSLTQARQWFFKPQSLRDLNSADFVLRVYLAPTIIIGDKQAVMRDIFHIPSQIKQTRSLLSL